MSEESREPVLEKHCVPARHVTGKDDITRIELDPETATFGYVCMLLSCDPRTTTGFGEELVRGLPVFSELQRCVNAGFGELTYDNLGAARLRLCRELGISVTDVDRMPIDEAVQELRKIASVASEGCNGRIIRPDAERNQWLYERYVNSPEKTLKAILGEAKAKGWTVGSVQNLRKAVKTHCRILKIDMPKRNEKRTKPK